MIIIFDFCNDDDIDDDDELIEILKCLFLPEIPRTSIKRLYKDEEIVPLMCEKEFKNAFCVSSALFQSL